MTARYETPLPKLVDEVEAFAVKVDGHLNAMGAELVTLIFLYGLIGQKASD